MAAPVISTLPTAPRIEDPANFPTQAAAHVASLPVLVSDLNAFGAYLNTGGFAADLSNIQITGGNIDGAVIGATTPAAGGFTSVTVTGTVDGRDIAADGTKLDATTITADAALPASAVSTWGLTLVDDTAASAARVTLELPETFISTGISYSPLAADRSKVIRCTASLTLSPVAAATLGDGWYVHIIADGGDVVVDPNAIETVNGSTTQTVLDGFTATLRCNGTELYLTDQKVQPRAPVNITAAATLPVTGASDTFIVSGTTTVTALAALPDGSKITLILAAATPFTHATTLKMPGGVSFAGASGDVLHMLRNGTNWECVGGIKADGSALASSGSLLTKLPAVLPPGTNSTLTLAHGRPGVPGEIVLFYICTAAYAGYAVGEQLLMHSFYENQGGSGIQISADASNLYIRTSVYGQTIISKTTGYPVAFSPARFSAQFYVGEPN